MKKSLMAFAGLAALNAGPALAQSSVTLFGVVDATLAHGSGSASSKTFLTNSGFSSSRVGFRGTEDLGGGMSASFWLEAGVNNDNGAGGTTNTNNQSTGAAPPAAGGQGLTFNRRATVSLAGNWGELRLGRDYTPQYWTLGLMDPFGSNGVGTSQTVNSLTVLTAVRASNTIGYLLPRNLGGFYGQAQYYLGENNSNAGTPAGSTKNDGSGYGLRLGFASGPFDVVLAHGLTRYAVGDFHQNNIGAAYDFGVVKLVAHFSFDKNDIATSGKGRGYLVGGLIPVGAGQIRLSYSRYQIELAAAKPTATKFAIGYNYNLSKRTALYATFAHVSNSGGSGQTLNGATLASPNDSSSGYDFGIRHSF
ncbi:MAG TPA: porin [Ramlibacter sp.]|uniref:porin n=1 Tax=Ramlibacter sp. TaxID=1917967 RepID=UPI002C267E9F|nr:porin [Ramlibacter sp.]HVZ42195.1 porin [Ramlibacter sp.]